MIDTWTPLAFKSRQQSPTDQGRHSVLFAIEVHESIGYVSEAVRPGQDFPNT